ncbi:MAG: hypothetical protein JSS22_16745 [Proteobacteria bacterium]|nr:hypothetical protein [Pseudomonadota bacterium]
MATLTSASTPNATPDDTHAGPWHEFRTFWREFIATAFRPYRPEQHYMRGPGPAWRAKHNHPSHSR